MFALLTFSSLQILSVSLLVILKADYPFPAHLQAFWFAPTIGRFDNVFLDLLSPWM